MFVSIVVECELEVLVSVVDVKGVKEEVSRFWSCCCFWNIAVRSFLVEKKLWVDEDVKLKLVEEEE